jgi:hypothetical protein
MGDISFKLKTITTIRITKTKSIMTKNNLNNHIWGFITSHVSSNVGTDVCRTSWRLKTRRGEQNGASPEREFVSPGIKMSFLKVYLRQGI